MRPPLEAVLASADERGVTVRWLPLGRWRGCYHQPTRTVYLRAGMSDRLAVPTLMHELEHARRGDDGHQSRPVETRIDRLVACRLITAGEYRRAEVLVGPHVGALAVELDVPRWVVEAYRDTLR
ncbi:ImmA/IrrE family metallo-endopeptidase [Actinomyces procaprae]|uniref:ImmA/IrrE family metallo-endopeptidase n=1 Tax=Actinomyces procaprae TaxID=2560010 RepID=UPI0010A240B2|nr:ImmA/IrrE family metallo-endopeptidase [Actinomyces procaprae]